jgi:hypothetical protein
MVHTFSWILPDVVPCIGDRRNRLGRGMGAGLFALICLLLAPPLRALDRDGLTFYLPFEGSYAPAIAPAGTQARLKDFVLPDMGMFKSLSDENRRYLEPDDKSPRRLEFVPGRRGLGLKTAANPTRFKVYSYPCVQYAVPGSFAPREGTIAFWMKPVGWTGLGGHLYFIAVTADNCTIRFYNYPGGTHVWVDAKDHYRLISASGWSGWKDGEWSFLAFTYKPGQQCVYADGELRSKCTDGLIEPEFVSTGLIEISEGDQVVDELMILNRPLTPAEVLGLYRANTPWQETTR